MNIKNIIEINYETRMIKLRSIINKLFMMELFPLSQRQISSDIMNKKQNNSSQI